MFIKFLSSKKFSEKISGPCPKCERFIYLDKNLLRHQKKFTCNKCKSKFNILSISFEKNIFMKVEND